MSRQRGLAAVAGAILVTLLSIFLVVRAVGVTVLDDPRPALEGAGAVGAFLGVGLLVGDAVLPVPSSLVMISLGALYGPFAGALLSLAGRFAMAVVGLALGRAGAGALVDHAAIARAPRIRARRRGGCARPGSRRSVTSSC